MIVGIFKLPYEPKASKNHMYGYTKAGRKFIHPQARAWRKELSNRIQDWRSNNSITLLPGHKVSIVVTCHFPPRGGRRGRKPDAPNFIDLTIDAVKDGLGIDDNSFDCHAINGDSDPGEGYIVCQVEL